MGESCGHIHFMRSVASELQVIDMNYFDSRELEYPHTDKVDLIPVYEFIFTKLKAQNLDWEYRNYYLAYLKQQEEFGPGYFTDFDDEGHNLENHVVFKAYTSRPTVCNFEGKGSKQPLFENRWGDLVVADLLELDFLNDMGDSYKHLGTLPVMASQTFEQELERVQNTPPTGKVQAYYNVYGKWPRGYSVGRFDY